TDPTFQRFLLLAVGAILTKGSRTVTRILWTIGDLATGHHTDYHRLFTRAPWCSWKLGKVVTKLVIELAPPDEWVPVAIDDTEDQHKGKRVYGKGGITTPCDPRTITLSTSGDING
ncbi:MAG TPA: hypothetical protein EYP14_01915, partial [Planctomycetaceae bacterium]|nr:hypothetical protein [Planctomycetaceae bacterium]